MLYAYDDEYVRAKCCAIDDIKPNSIHLMVLYTYEVEMSVCLCGCVTIFKSYMHAASPPPQRFPAAERSGSRDEYMMMGGGDRNVPRGHDDGGRERGRYGDVKRGDYNRGRYGDRR